jgi:hypothetical protein
MEIGARGEVASAPREASGALATGNAERRSARIGLAGRTYRPAAWRRRAFSEPCADLRRILGRSRVEVERTVAGHRTHSWLGAVSGIDIAPQRGCHDTDRYPEARSR